MASKLTTKDKARKRRKKSAGGLPAKGRLRDMADCLWSLAVRADWDGRCAVCGKRDCEAHHLVPRQFEATRYTLRNGIALCCGCHKFNKDISPHLNAAAFVKWLEWNHPNVAAWYFENCRPHFTGQKTAAYYCGVIESLRQYVEPEDFERIVGVKFARHLEAMKGVHGC